MTTIPQPVARLQTLLTALADEAARRTGFTLRASKLSGSAFVQTLVFGFLSDPHGRLSSLSEMSARVGSPVSPQSLDERFTERAAAGLLRVLEAALGALVSGPEAAAPLLGRFTSVALHDSTVVRLPDALASVWPGWGGRGAGGRTRR